MFSTFVAATPLISRSAASTPVTASEKFTWMALSVVTVEPAMGDCPLTTGATSSSVPVRLASKPRSLLPRPALNTWTVSTFVPVGLR